MSGGSSGAYKMKTLWQLSLIRESQVCGIIKELYDLCINVGGNNKGRAKSGHLGAQRWITLALQSKYP